MLICVSLLQVVLGLTIKEATVLSQAAISGGALSGALFSVFRSHPTDSRAPLLDFRMALVLMPVLLLGTSVGKVFSKALCLPAQATLLLRPISPPQATCARRCSIYAWRSCCCLSSGWAPALVASGSPNIPVSPAMCPDWVTTSARSTDPLILF